MFIQPSEYTTIENFNKVDALCLYQQDDACSYGKTSEITVILYITGDGDDVDYQGVEIGHMKLYRTSWYYSSWGWADCHSGMLVDMHNMKEEVCGQGKRQCNSTWFDDDAMGSDHFFLTEMYLKPEFRQKGLGYKAMHTGLIECGASHNFVYVYPSKSEEDMGFKYLKKFYMGMDKNTRYSPKYGTIVCPNYNYTGSAKKKSSRATVKELAHAA